MTAGHHNEPELERRIRRNALMVGGFALLIFVLYRALQRVEGIEEEE